MPSRYFKFPWVASVIIILIIIFVATISATSVGNIIDIPGRCQKTYKERKM